MKHPDILPGVNNSCLKRSVFERTVTREGARLGSGHPQPTAVSYSLLPIATRN